MKRTTVVEGVPRSGRAPRPSRDEGLTLIHDHHEAYIPWDVYERNQYLIDHNATSKGARVRGAVRGGDRACARPAALWSLRPKASRALWGAGSRYECVSGHTNHGTERCISFGSWRVDQAMEAENLRVISPGAIEAAVAEASTTMEEQADGRQALQLEVQEARFEAERARRQYERVEPEHRLVATTLERRWNEALQRVQELEQRLEALYAQSPPHQVPDQTSLLALTDDLPRVWAAAEVQAEKRIVRLLVEEIIAKAVADPTARIALVVHWKGASTPSSRSPDSNADNTGAAPTRPPSMSCVIWRGASQTTRSPASSIAWAIAPGRARAGRKGASLHSGTITTSPSTKPPGGHAVLTLGQAARTLGVNKPFVQRLIALGLLPATQPVLYAPWSIRPEDLGTEAVQQAVASARSGRPLPRQDNTNQLSFDNSTA
jgi:hypothetical protein